MKYLWSMLLIASSFGAFGQTDANEGCDQVALVLASATNLAISTKGPMANGCTTLTDITTASGKNTVVVIATAPGSSSYKRAASIADGNSKRTRSTNSLRTGFFDSMTRLPADLTRRLFLVRGFESAASEERHTYFSYMILDAATMNHRNGNGLYAGKHDLEFVPFGTSAAKAVEQFQPIDANVGGYDICKYVQLVAPKMSNKNFQVNSVATSGGMGDGFYTPTTFSTLRLFGNALNTDIKGALGVLALTTTTAAVLS